MPTLDWIGKKAVVNHHREVPYRLIHCDRELSAGDPEAGNLLVQGDNLEALKALLPYYAGKVKCIYIDPPYNTGEESWVYNDNIASPEIKAWLGRVVGRNYEDLSRHDKWLCMIYPRIRVLKEFLCSDGAIFVSVDDNEMYNLRMCLDEVFGPNNFAATFIWERRTTRENRKVFSVSHEYVVCYAKDYALFKEARIEFPVTEEIRNRYSNPDNDPRGPWQSVSLNAQAGHGVASQFYEVTLPSGRTISHPAGRCWSVTKDRFEELVRDNRVWFGSSGDNVPRLKKFLSESERGITPHTLWTAKEVGTTDSARKGLMQIFGGEDRFQTPKSLRLVERIIAMATGSEDIVLVD